ncbi:MAG TPA: hypothetical protein VGC21_04410 [Telluria sp.]|jgi:hypothetical protein
MVSLTLMARLTRLLPLALLLAGCRERAVSPPPAPPPAPAHNTVSAVQVATPAEVAALVLAVDGEGLRLFNSVSGAARPIPFGTGKDDALALVTRSRKVPPQEQGDSADCGASYARWPGGLSLWFVDGKFAGWSLTPEASAVSTASGLRPGSTRAELESAYQASVVDSTLGVEFTAGGLGGLLDSRRPDAKVTHLWAGTTCLDR